LALCDPPRLGRQPASARNRALHRQSEAVGDEAGRKADQISDDGLRSIDEAAPDDVAASDLRAVQRAIASGRWRENSQAKKWAGHAVAAAMKLDVETHKAKIVALLKTWIGNGALVVVEGEDEQRKKRSFVEIGSVAE
jgi:hypothetical protein